MKSATLTVLFLVTFCWIKSQAFRLGRDDSQPQPGPKNGIDVELIENGTSYKLTSMQDGMVSFFALLW